MGFWSAVKRGLGIGSPRGADTRRLQKRQRTPSIIESSAGSGTIASSRTSVTASRAAPPTESGVLVNTPSFYPSVPTVPEEIEIIEDDTVPPPAPAAVQPKKIGFWRRFSRRNKKRAEVAPAAQSGYTIPSTSDLMHGVAPIAPSATDSALRDQVREAMGLPPRTPRSDAPSIRSEASYVPSFTRSPPPVRLSPVPSPSRRAGSLGGVASSSPKAPTPPLARQTPRLQTVNAPLPSSRSTPPKSVRSVSGGLSGRKIAIRELGQDGTDADVQSVAAMSYLSRKSKTARIFEVAEVISGDVPLSPVSEEVTIGKVPSVKGTGSLAAIEEWALKHSTRLDMIDEKLQTLKAEILQNKPKRRYFTT